MSSQSTEFKTQDEWLEAQWNRRRDALEEIEKVLRGLPAHLPYRERDVEAIKRAWEMAREGLKEVR